MDGNASPFFTVLVNGVRPFSQNGTERTDKNYGLKTTVLRPYYKMEFETFFWLLLYIHLNVFVLGGYRYFPLHGASGPFSP